MRQEESNLTPPVVDLALEVADRQKVFGGLSIDRFRGLIGRTLARENIPAAEISLVLVDDATIRSINNEHLSHDWETDVITFPLSDPDDVPLCGELIVSAEMARATALSVNADPWAELSLYIVHGLMHLVGHDDLTPEAAELMRERESFHLAAEGLANTFKLVETSGPALPREDEPCPA